MSSVSQSHTNISVEWRFMRMLEKGMISSLTTLSCCVFLYINGIMLFTLRRKTVFLETPRYVLLYNLLFADTLQLAQGQLLYMMTFFKVPVMYPVCGFLILVTSATSMISPLTLVVMPLERYVAVCYPLRHAAIVTIRNTEWAILVIWAVSSLNNLIRALLFLQFPFERLDISQAKDVCSTITILLVSFSADYDKAFTCVVFVSAGVTVTFSYIGVAVAARSASTDKASARKAHNTLLLNVAQLGLSLCSTVYYPVFVALSRIVPRLVFLRVQNVFYVLFTLLPRCLSSLIYGLRDQTIRPVLLYHLCCRLKRSSSQWLKSRSWGGLHSSVS